jgi:hypothetical protein
MHWEGWGRKWSHCILGQGKGLTLFFCLIKRRAAKTCAGVKVWLNVGPIRFIPEEKAPGSH